MTKRVSDFQPKQFDLEDWRKADSIIGKDFDLLEVQFRQGRKGEYACMRCKDLETSKEFGLNCGGVVVVKKIKEALSRATLPLTLQIISNGKYMDVK